MYLSRLSSLLLLSLLTLSIAACKKDKDTNANTDITPYDTNFDFRWTPPTYVYAATKVLFTTQNVDKSSTISWMIMGQKYTGDSVRVEFPKGGEYPITLTINNDEANSRTKNITVYPRTINFYYEGATCADDTVFFISRYTDGGTHSWDFGDGNTSTENDPFHIYKQKGYYTVTLEVTGLEDAPLKYVNKLNISKDPIHTQKMVGSKTWSVSRREVDDMQGLDSSYTLPNETFSLTYVHKAAVSFPSKQGELQWPFIYNEGASVGDVLVYIRYGDSLFYNPVVDTVLIVGHSQYAPGSGSPTWRMYTYWQAP